MLRTLWIIALIGSALGLLVLVVALFGFSDNSMHLAALPAVSPGLATVLHCLARAKSALDGMNKRQAGSQATERRISTRLGHTTMALGTPEKRSWANCAVTRGQHASAHLSL